LISNFKSKIKTSIMSQNLPDAAVLRIIDANVNRAAEGLRVVEDYSRFVLNDRRFTETCKGMRHRLTAAMGPWLARAIIHRDARADVGAEITTDSEFVRNSTASVAIANLKRVQQALRTVEEFAKTFDATAAGACESLRYQAYELDSTFRSLMDGRRRLGEARLYVLIDVPDFDRLIREEFIDIMEAGIDVLQLRNKNLDDRRLIQRARALREITRDRGRVFVINDRPDIARLVDADGVHLGQDDMSVREARSIVGSESLIGVSTHSIEQAEQAVLDGANYIGLGPMFPSTTKEFDQFAGLDLLGEVNENLSIPAFAIGGINETNIDRITEHGGHRVAVLGAIWSAADPAEAVGRLRKQLRADSDTAF
jgi:thiamine-phosphate pyrophosphorylase